VYAEENVMVLQDDVIAELIAGILADSGVDTGSDALDAHPECMVEGEVAIGWSTTSNEIGRRFSKRRKIRPKTTARMMPPVIPPAMAGVLDLYEDLEGVDGVGSEDGVVDARIEEGESGEGGEGVGVGVATTNSGL
jgi:hypothetical protein